MTDPKGFLKTPRETPARVPAERRRQNWLEFYESFPAERLQLQASRCMNCGIPFCHEGCPLGNLIPGWNNLSWQGQWRTALTALHTTNNFPEFTGKLCPAPCESACVLGISDRPVTIRLTEESLANRGWAEGWITPQHPLRETGRSVAVVGSGPAGLAAAQQLRRVGHCVKVYERDDRPGGLLRYGIPDFKMEKWVLDRRLEQMRQEGVAFEMGVEIGVDLPASELLEQFDAIVLAGGCTVPRDLPVPGRHLAGVHMAMEFLVQQNRRCAGTPAPGAAYISAAGKRVVILGGGDTGADCLGTVHRQGASEVVQLELMPRPPDERTSASPWPAHPAIFRSSAAHEEGGTRDWSVRTNGFRGAGGRVAALEACRLQWAAGANGRLEPEVVPGSQFAIECELVLLALGFVSPEASRMLQQLDIKLSERGCVQTGSEYMTEVPGVFACGDMRRGQSLIVWAIAEGREAARAVDIWLMGDSHLPATRGRMCTSVGPTAT
ncbi:MAG: glutamate synthase subunit beta [Armatimonadetes bacterium]|nr:glutamate synthase subunit beta [Armatimonadota bacterium]MDE2205711.1 glutamate synthase subunit beta [Armatimonadota bacterium]